MTATAHALVGATLAAAFPNPLIAIPLALASHIVCDLVPHWDSGTAYEKKRKTISRLFYESVFDVSLGFLAVVLLVLYVFPQTNMLYALFMAVCAQWLDWIAMPYIVFKWKFPPFTWTYHLSFHTNTMLDKPWGVVTQVVFVFALIVFVKFF